MFPFTKGNAMKKRGMNCFFAHSMSTLLTMGGFVIAMIACGIGQMGGCEPLAIVLAVLGIGGMAAEAAVGYGFIVCPHCGRLLYDFLRIPSKIPTYCPHCGEYIEEPDI